MRERTLFGAPGEQTYDRQDTDLAAAMAGLRYTVLEQSKRLNEIADDIRGKQAA